MTLLISAFGFAGRWAGDLLMSALGWASSLLFGRVPRSHQVFLVGMMAASFLWLIVVLCLVLPSVASFLLAATPHPPFVDNAWLGWALLAGAVLLPLVIGMAGYLVPAAGERPEGLRVLGELLRGYLLAPLISGLLIYLAVVGMARKARSKRHGWSDSHVAIVVEPGGYERLASDVEAAVRSAGLEVTVHDAPRALTVPAWLLTKVAGENVRALRPDRLLDLNGRHLRIGIYPSDIAISGAVGSRTRARVAILSRLVAAEAHLTISAEAQAVEDRLREVAKSAASRRRAAFDDIDASLLELDVPTDEWDTLYRIRLQVERDLLAGREPGTVFPGEEAPDSEPAPGGAPVERSPGSSGERRSRDSSEEPRTPGSGRNLRPDAARPSATTPS